MTMKKIVLIFLSVLIFIPCTTIWAQVSFTRTGAQDFYRVKSALLPRRKTFDFRFATQYQSTDNAFKVPVNALDTLNVAGSSTLANLQWMLSYSVNNNLELSVSGMAFYDKNESVYRYGAGDTRIGVRYTTPNLETEFNWGIEAFYSLPTGFDQGDRLVRAFASDKGGWGGALYVDFSWKNWSAKVNGTYFNAGGKVENIAQPFNTFWYNTLDGIYGISPNGETIQSSQANFGVGLSRNFFYGTRLFAEYYAYNVFTKEGDGKSLGNVSAGLSLYQKPGFDLKIGYDMPLGEIRPSSGIFLDLRMNGIIGGRRVLIPTVPVISEEEPTLSPGRKPFFRREGVVYSRVREPIRDTVFIIDGTPSMLGRGTVEGNRGEEVARNIIDFIQVLIDSTKESSNISLITFSDEITNLSWRSIDESKKEEIKNSVRDVPDQMNFKADDLETRNSSRPWKEMLEEAIIRGYQELAAFSRADYNKIHLQRIVIFSDGIDDSSTPHNLETAFNSIMRRYQLDREDFRYAYYLHTNPRGEGVKVDDSIITFVEKENGKVFRALDIANVGEEFVQELAYNNIAQRSSLRYQSQITRIAVVDFNTKGMGNVRQPLIEAFNKIFDYNDYFVVKPQAEVEAVMASESTGSNRQPDLRDLVRVGRRLGVDYVVYGEVINYTVNRGKGFYIPYFFGLPKTEISIDVAIRLVDVAEGTLEYVNTISSNSSRRDGFIMFPRSRENKMKQLSGVEQMDLHKKLMERWAQRLRESMFEDRSIIIP